MKLIAPDSSARDLIQDVAENQHVADYVYMYPPRQVYRKLQSSPAVQIANSIRARESINLYFHVPFCSQICHFCNLYTTALPESLHAEYVSQLKAELRTYSSQIASLRIDTIYIGGGTPSLFRPELIRDLLDTAKHVAPNLAANCEIAIEVAPEHIGHAGLLALKHAGINRINLGVQSTVPSEIKAFGRRRSERTDVQLVEDALTVGFSNVCVDLIYGLKNQTDESWISSLRSVILKRPQTICCYALTARPFTGFAQRGGVVNHGDTFLRRYDIANSMLLGAGYRQETHVRWSIPGGGYLQKQYHWAMGNLLGFGAGARSYLWDIDVRNGYSVMRRNSLLREYIAHDFSDGLFHRDGYEMPLDEKKRKFVILGLGNLDTNKYFEYFASSPIHDFPDVFDALNDYGLLAFDGPFISLTARGLRHRDSIVQSMFSDRVKTRLKEFDYRE